MSARRYPMELPRDPARPWAPSPFGRLARAHALGVAGDAVFTTAMAGLVFFSVARLDQARWQVAAALAFTIVPFSLAAPFIGPLIDRAPGGRKWMVVALGAGRALICLSLAASRDNQLTLYPRFTLVLVLAQGYSAARSALVPTAVRSDEELVQANAKLAVISGVSAVAAGAVSLTVLWVSSVVSPDAGPGLALALAAAAYVAAAAEAGRLPAVRIAPGPPGEAETEELHGAGIRVAAVALSVVRVAVGFTTFLLAFHFKDLAGVDPWASRVGLAGSVVLAQAGYLGGSALVTRARRALVEEQIILGALVVIGVVGLTTTLLGDLPGALVLALGVGLASSSAKQSFDAVVQRDAPDANRGRAFARFEARLQLWWVAGALVPVAVTLPPAVGALVVGLAGTLGAVWFLARRPRPGPVARPVVAGRGGTGADEPLLVEPRPVSRAFLGGRVPAPRPIDATALLGPDGDGDGDAAPFEDLDRTADWPAPGPPPPAGPDRPPTDPQPADLPVTDRLVTDRPVGGPGRSWTLADEDDLAAPSDVAWFHRPGRHAEGGAGRGWPGGSWGSAAPPRRRWDDRPGDPDDDR